MAIALNKTRAKELAMPIDIDTASLARALADNIVDCESLSLTTTAGASHQHFLLRGEKSNYIIKIFPHQPFAITRAITMQRKFYDFFHHRGVMTPPALYGDEQCLVLPWVGGLSDGRLVTKEKNADDDLARSLARQLAIIHDGKDDFRKDFAAICYDESLAVWHRQKSNEIEKLLNDALPMDKQSTRAALAAIEKLWAALPTNLLPDMVPCHGDFRTGNFLLQKRSRAESPAQPGQPGHLRGHDLVAVLDWEMAGFGMAWEDIGWLSAPCWLYHQPQLTCGGLARLEVFLQHYLARRKTIHQSITWQQVMAQNHWFQALALIRWGLLLSKQWHRKQHGLDILPELPQVKPDVAQVFAQAQQMLHKKG